MREQRKNERTKEKKKKDKYSSININSSVYCCVGVFFRMFFLLVDIQHAYVVTTYLVVFIRPIIDTRVGTITKLRGHEL